MRVSWRHRLAGAGGAAILATIGLTAMGQSCATCRPVPSPPPPPQHGCCETPRNLVVNIPGVNVAAASVHVGATSTAFASASVSTTLTSGVVAQAGASGNASTFLGGGGSHYANPGVGQSTISNLAVDGGYETRLVEEEVVGLEDICLDRIVEERRVRPIQAVCIDDRNTPHPASRVDAELSVDGGYRGEIYRCMAGTHMQVTLGEMVNGQASFETGETFSCGKGEALWHGPGGAVQCRPQKPERDCNERSLLRKFGPGIKLVSMATSRTMCVPTQRQTVTKVVKEVKVPRPVAAGSLVLDGGVGQGY